MTENDREKYDKVPDVGIEPVPEIRDRGTQTPIEIIDGTLEKLKRGEIPSPADDHPGGPTIH